MLAGIVTVTGPPGRTLDGALRTAQLEVGGTVAAVGTKALSSFWKRVTEAVAGLEAAVAGVASCRDVSTEGTAGMVTAEFVLVLDVIDAVAEDKIGGTEELDVVKEVEDAELESTSGGASDRTSK